MKKANLWNILKVISAHLATYALLLTSFAPVAVMADAEPTPTPQATATPDMSNMTEADIEAMTQLQDEGTAASANDAQDEQNNNRSNLDEVDATTAMWISIISGIVIGYLTASMLAACQKMTSDMYIAAAAGIVYVYGEINATLKDKETREEIEEAYDKCKNQEDDCQYGALEAEKASYNEIAETAKEKQELHEYAAYGLAAAAALALFWTTKEKVNKGTCTTSLGTAETAALLGPASPPCKPTCSVPDPTPATKAACVACTADVEKCAGGLATAITALGKEEVIANTPQDSKLQSTERVAAQGMSETSYSMGCAGPYSGQLLGGVAGPCKSYVALANEKQSICNFRTMMVVDGKPQNRPYGPDIFDQNDTNNLLRKYFEVKVEKNEQLHALFPDKEKKNQFISFWRKAYFGGLDILSPEGQAMLEDFSSYMGFGGAAIGIWFGLKSTTANAFDMWIGSPPGRATFFGVMSGLVYYSSTVTGDIAADATSNSNKINSVLNNRRNENEEGTEIERQGRQRQDVVTTTGTGTGPGTVATEEESGTPPLCANGANGNGGCNQVPGVSGADTSFLNGFMGTNGASNLLAVANDVNDGAITAQSQQVVGSSSGSGAIAMKKLRKQRSDYLKNLKKENPKAFENAVKLENYAKKSIQSGVMKVLKKAKATPAQFLAAVGTGKMPSLKETDKNKRVAAIKGSITGKKVGSIALGGSSGKKDWSMKFNFDEEAAKEDVTAVSGNSETMAMSEENGKVVGSQNAEDIMGRNNNIWQEITKRYIRTAYPVLLEQL
ncbi:MAG: hypothetical protein GY909_17130 [Oligoflexia bacterium]|nr:hypothetical protein [Oligoflexia bacterium]